MGTEGRDVGNGIRQYFSDGRPGLRAESTKRVFIRDPKRKAAPATGTGRCGPPFFWSTRALVQPWAIAPDRKAVRGGKAGKKQEQPARLRQDSAEEGRPAAMQDLFRRVAFREGGQLRSPSFLARV